MEYKHYIEKITTKKSLHIIGIIILFLISFKAGELVGHKKAAFSFGNSERYYQMFGNDRRGIKMMRGIREDFPNRFGAYGKIVSISLPTVVIEGRENIEKVISITTKTLIRNGRNEITSSDLKVGDEITVLGAPNKDSVIEATLIRIMPKLKSAMINTPERK